jgi:hypothetical protein
MTEIITPAAGPFTAQRVQGRYRVLDEAGQIVVTLNSKAKAEARAEELNREALSFAQIVSDVEMEQAMDDECPPLTEEELAFIAEQEPKVAAANAAWEAAQEPQEEPAQGAGTSDTPAQEEKPQEAAKPVEKPAKRTPKPAAGQPAPHAFTTVGTKIKNHCTDCGRSWAAAAHRKFREEQGTAPAAAEAEWTPAADDTTQDGKAPAESAQG